MVQDRSFDDQQGGEKDILDLKAEPAAPAAETTAPAPDADTGPIETEALESATSPEPENPSLSRPEASPVISGSAPKMIGAGILGGLIALLAAGSMQYAGYLPAALPEKSAGENPAALEALRTEIDGLKQQLATIPADIQPTDALEKRLAALEARPQAPGADPEAQSRVAALEERLNTLQQTATQGEAAANQKIADLTSRLAEAENTLKQRPGETAVSKTIAATYLKAAVDRGDPFLTELETFAALSPDDPAIAGLRPLAAAGLRSKVDLVRSFDAIARAVMDAVNQPVAGEGWTDRLLSSARSLVSVRPVGNVEGADPGAILARMEDKLKNGDLKGAALEWEALPENARKASADFKQALDNRIKADELTGALVERTKTSALQAG